MIVIRKSRAALSLAASKVAIFILIRLLFLMFCHRVTCLAMLYFLGAWRLARLSDQLNFFPALMAHFLSMTLTILAAQLVLDMDIQDID